jgi:hypothetical protein
MVHSSCGACDRVVKRGGACMSEEHALLLMMAFRARSASIDDSGVRSNASGHGGSSDCAGVTTTIYSTGYDKQHRCLRLCQRRVSGACASLHFRYWTTR